MRSWQRVAIVAYPLPLPIFKFYPGPTPKPPLPPCLGHLSHCSFCCLVSLTEWVIVPNLMCYFTYWIDTFGAMVPEGTCCVFYSTKC